MLQPGAEPCSVLPDRAFGSGGAEIVRSSFEFLGEGDQGTQAQSGGQRCLSQAPALNGAGCRHSLMAHCYPQRLVPVPGWFGLFLLDKDP